MKTRRRTGAMLASIGAVLAWGIAAASAPAAQIRPHGPYLGMTPPGPTPQVFAPGFISTPAHEFSCSFTPDGKEFYFARSDPKSRMPLIMVTTCVDDTWTEPAIAPFARTGRMSFEPRVTPDGRRLYFQTQNPNREQVGLAMVVRYVEREGDGWSGPKDPGSLLNPQKAMFISMTLDGTLYTTDISGGPGTESIASARLVDGKYHGLEKVGPPISVGKNDMYPCVAPDGSFLIFNSSRIGQRPSSVLFISYRLPDGAWSEPRAIDLGIEAGTPTLSPDGKYLFFTGGERGKSDIYWVAAKFISEMKPSGTTSGS